LFDSLRTLDYASFSSTPKLNARNARKDGYPVESEASFIGIDLSGPTLRAAVVNSAGVIGDRQEAQLEADRLVEQVAQIVRDLRRGTASIASVGIANRAG